MVVLIMGKITAKFTNFGTDSNWCSGVAGDYKFEAKLFDDGSCFGINFGRVSKLSLKRLATVGNGQNWFNGVVVNYDRGWDIKPKRIAGVRAAYNAVMELLENAPKRFENE